MAPRNRALSRGWWGARGGDPNLGPGATATQGRAGRVGNDPPVAPGVKGAWGEFARPAEGLCAQEASPETPAVGVASKAAAGRQTFYFPTSRCPQQGLQGSGAGD